MAEPDVEALIRRLLLSMAAERPAAVPEPAPSLPRAYTTTVWDTSPHHRALDIMSLPLSPDWTLDVRLHPEDDQRARRLAVEFGLVVRQDVEIESLVSAVVSTLWGSTDLPLSDPLVRFAARAVLEPLVMVEGSAARGQSLSRLLTGSGASAVLTFTYGEPLLLLATPVAVILLGAAGGIGRALDEGLYKVIYRWLTGSEPPEPEESVSPAPE